MCCVRKKNYKADQSGVRKGVTISQLARHSALHMHVTVEITAHALCATLSMFNLQFNAYSTSFRFNSNLALGVAVNKPCNKSSAVK